MSCLSFTELQERNNCRLVVIHSDRVLLPHSGKYKAKLLYWHLTFIIYNSGLDVRHIPNIGGRKEMMIPCLKAQSKDRHVKEIKERKQAMYIQHI